MSAHLLIIFCFLFFFNDARPADSVKDDASSHANSSFVLKPVKENFITLSNKNHPANRIGYRVFEHEPIPWGEVPLSTHKANIDTAKISILIKSYAQQRDVFIYRQVIEKHDRWSKQNWTYYFRPVSDGIEISLLIETFQEGLPEYYGIQQCFRLSGETNAEWRKEIACTPAFSEYDLWDKEKKCIRSLTSVYRKEGWSDFPAMTKTVGARTPLGIAIDYLRTDGKPEAEVGPYKATMLEPVDNGLITRSNLEGTWVCGLYWESTSHVTNHHPADCLHAIVNIGNIPPFSKRMLRGKIYWFKGTKVDLANHYKRDFAEGRKGKLKIASCQFPICSDIKENASWIKRQMRMAGINGCDIVHFPEGALSGYAGEDFDSFNKFDWTGLWNETDSILTLAKKLKLWVLLGSAHKLTGENKPHNSLYVISKEGEIIDRYDKRFSTIGDLNFYSSGDHFTVFEINNVKCGLLICYDVRFPELYRQYKKLNADILFQSFNNSRHGLDCIHPKIMPITCQAHAGINYFYMSITNSSAPYSWPCHFITPDGLVDGKLEANIPGLLISDVDVSKDFYDASKPYRMDAINGKLNSGETVSDSLSLKRRGYK